MKVAAFWLTILVLIWAWSLVASVRGGPPPIVPQRGQVLMWDGKIWRPVTVKLVCTPAGRGSATLNCVAVLP